VWKKEKTSRISDKVMKKRKEEEKAKMEEEKKKEKKEDAVLVILMSASDSKARFPSKRNRLRCVRCVWIETGLNASACVGNASSQSWLPLLRPSILLVAAYASACV